MEAVPFGNAHLSPPCPGVEAPDGNGFVTFVMFFTPADTPCCFSQALTVDVLP